MSMRHSVAAAGVRSQQRHVADRVDQTRDPRRLFVDRFDRIALERRTTVPARNAPLSAKDWAEIKSTYPEIRRLLKNSLAGFPYMLTERSAKDVDEEERTAIYEELWAHGGFKFLWGSFFDIMIDLEANATAADFIRGKIRETIDDPKVADWAPPG